MTLLPFTLLYLLPFLFVLKYAEGEFDEWLIFLVAALWPVTFLLMLIFIPKDDM